MKTLLVFAMQIQAETAVGKGEYSQEKEVFPPTIGSCEYNNTYVDTLPSWKGDDA